MRLRTMTSARLRGLFLLECPQNMNWTSVMSFTAQIPPVYNQDSEHRRTLIEFSPRVGPGELPLGNLNFSCNLRSVHHEVAIKRRFIKFRQMYAGVLAILKRNLYNARYVSTIRTHRLKESGRQRAQKFILSRV